MAAIDTIASYQGTSGSTLAAGVWATGDSGTIRNFPDSAQARLLTVGYDDVTAASTFRIRSPLLHDNVDGIQFDPGSAAPSELLSPQIVQPLQAQDTLTAEFTTAATTGKALGAFGIFYSQLPGATARLYMRGDIQGNVRNIKPVRIAVGSGANTAGAWYDLVITTTENLLHANTDYAVLGAAFNQAVAVVGVKGTDTGNLRVCVPGGTNNPYSPEAFVRLSEQSGLPTIPVINAANAGSTYASIVSSAATGAAGVITLFLAELAHNLS
jgi:hypothetical protein